MRSTLASATVRRVSSAAAGHPSVGSPGGSARPLYHTPGLFRALATTAAQMAGEKKTKRNRAGSFEDDLAVSARALLYPGRAREGLAARARRAQHAAEVSVTQADRGQRSRAYATYRTGRHAAQDAQRSHDSVPVALSQPILLSTARATARHRSSGELSSLSASAPGERGHPGAPEFSRSR